MSVSLAFFLRLGVCLTTRCLTNIASSHTRHTEHILGAAPQLISFLSAPNPALQEQALWALGNIAGDSSDFREMLHANGALLPIFRLLQNPPVRAHILTCTGPVMKNPWSASCKDHFLVTPMRPFFFACIFVHEYSCSTVVYVYKLF